MRDIFKKLLKTATQILKLGDSKTIAASENFIGTGYFAVKKEVIKTLDTVFAKRAEDIKTLNYEILVPSVINNDYELVENIEVRKNYTQLISKSVTSYLNTSYYIFFNNYIKDLQLYVKSAVDPVILSDKNNEILGIILPIRVQNDIVLKGSGIIDSDIIDIDNTHVYINVESLNYEEKEKLKDLGFKRFSRGRYIKVFSHDILRNLGFSLSHEVFENDITLTELKEELRQKDIKKEIEQNMVIESYEKLLPFYQNIINNLINDGYKIKGLSIKLSPKKTCYYFYIDTDKKEFDLGFICNKGNLNLNKTQQKALFKMLKDNLVLEDKINDLSTPEVAAEKFYIKNERGEYEQVAGVRLENKYNFDLFYHEIALSNYIITHAPTGVAISGTMTGCKEDLLKKLDALVEKNGVNNILKMFNDVISKEGYAPEKQIKEEFHINETSADPGTNIKCLYSVTHENDIEKIDIIPSNNLNEVSMNLQLLAAEKVKSINLRPIYNDDIEGHKEYQIEQLKLYNSNTLKFQKKRITHKMIEQYTKYFIYDNKTFMAVKPSKDGIYPTGYYQHVKQYDSLVDIDNKIILFRDHGTLESLEEVQNV